MLNSVEADAADPQETNHMGERIQPAASAAALIRCGPPGLSDGRWIMTVAKAPKPAQHETSECRS